jgi:hypothetical protein
MSARQCADAIGAAMTTRDLDGLLAVYADGEEYRLLAARAVARPVHHGYEIPRDPTHPPLLT